MKDFKYASGMIFRYDFDKLSLRSHPKSSIQMIKLSEVSTIIEEACRLNAKLASAWHRMQVTLHHTEAFPEGFLQRGP